MKIKQNKGISLIVLIITIIVMIILATAIILSLNGSGIIGRANEAKTSMDLASAQDVATLAYSEWSLMPEETRGDFATYATAKLAEQGFKTGKETGALEVGNNGVVYSYPTIPEGFIASDLTDEDSVGEGLVIYEGTAKVSTDTDAKTTRNQFVWIPVKSMSDFVLKQGNYDDPNEATIVQIKDSLEPFSGTVSGVTMSLENDLTGEFAEYAAMKASVEKYGGFYVARYEAGDGTVTSARTGTTNVINTVVSKKNAFVYNIVPWGKSMTDITKSTYGIGAVELARSMYNEEDDMAVKSHLIYGVQWDAIVSYISDAVSITNSNSWANIGGTSTIQPTGSNENWKAKNIYDLAGNAFEWTMEATYRNNAWCRVVRGASADQANGIGWPVTYRYNSSIGYAGNYGFRTCIIMDV